MNVIDLFSGLEGWAIPFRERDVILASPPCECFSVASIGKHWTGGKCARYPKDERTKKALQLLEHTLYLIEHSNCKYWWLENPRGMMRKMDCVQRYRRVTVTYCKYGEYRMKPTDLWGIWPSTWKPHPPCKNGDPCHVRAPRGSSTGTQGYGSYAEKSKIPYPLALQVCLACELAFGRGDNGVEQYF